MAENAVKAKRQQYMIGGPLGACDWRWPKGLPVWRMSYKDGCEWVEEDLTEEGRMMILNHFGLSGDDLPLAVLAETSPAKLAEMRCAFEEQSSISSRLDIRCQRVGGGHVPAEECC